MAILPTELYRADQVRELDRTAIERFGIPGGELMGRAGAAAFALIRTRWPQAARIGVFCGAGNNGGDGYVIAGLAREAGLSVRVYQLGDPERASGDARAAREAALAAGVPMEPYTGQEFGGFDLLVDALLGTGLGGEVREPLAGAIAALNRAACPVLAVDIPSGLHADTGAVLGCAVRADVTVTFIGLKQGLFTGEGPQQCGIVRFDDLAVPAQVYRITAPAARRLDAGRIAAALGPRPRSAHKGWYGHVLVVGGDHGMGGAARMAAEAAARVGAGLVSLATRSVHTAAITALRPELMCHAVEQPDALAPLLERASVVALGPGLGRGEWGRGLLEAVLAAGKPLVVDADGLNLLAGRRLRRDDWVLTPHPGEAGRLLGRSAGEVQADRFAAVAALQQRFGGSCVLKGAGTLVQGPDPAPAVCCAGNPGMASGGMGDTLTGIIAGLMAQGLTGNEAAEVGVCLHGAAADAAAKEGERGLLASDLLPYLRRLANPRT